MNKWKFSVLVLLVLLAGLCGGIQYGERIRDIQEYKHYLNLVTGTHFQKMDPQFQEYSKARFYYFANLLPISYIYGVRIYDFGPVNETILGGIGIGKGPTTATAEYDKHRFRIQQLNAKKGW